MAVATATGEPYATAHQLARLEEMVQKQQIHIELLEKERKLFQYGIEDYLTNQQESAAAQRGSKGQDVIVMTKYISTCFQRALQQLQTDVAKQINDSLPMKQLQTLERRLISRPYSNEEVAELAQRISHLEAKREPALQSTQQVVQITGPSSEEINSLREHINHLETNLIKEVQRAYSTVHKPGDYAGPLGKLQVDVDTLKREIQMVKALDGQTLAENIMKAAIVNLRTEFQETLSKKASIDDLEAFRSQVERTEIFLRKLQTHWSTVYMQYNTFRKEMTEQFTEDRWLALEKQLVGETQAATKAVQTNTDRMVAKQTTALDEMLDWNRTTLKRLYESVKQHTSQDALERNMSKIQKVLLARFDPAIETMRIHLNRRMDGVEQLQQTNRQQQLEFISEMKHTLSATELTKQYAKFEERLAEQTRTYEANQKQATGFETKSKQLIEMMKVIQEDTRQQIADVDKTVAGIRNAIQQEQSQARHSIETWCGQRKTTFDTSLQTLHERLQAFHDQVSIAQQSLQLTVDSRKQFEDKHAEQIQQMKQDIQKTTKGFEEATTDRITTRLAEVSGPIRVAMRELTEQQQVVNQFLSEQSLQEFVRTIETRIKKGQDDWQRIRSSELHEAISFFGAKLSTMDQSMQNELANHRTTIQSLQSRLGDRYRRELTELRDKYAQIRPLIQKQILESMKQYNSLTPIKLIRSVPTWIDTAPKCFYTAIIGAPGQKIDSLAPVERIPGWDYICFTNKPIHDPKGWTIVRVDMPKGSAALDAKRYKWQTLEMLAEYEIVVWVDGYIAPSASSRQLLERWITGMKETGHSMMLRPHDQRVCIWEECEAVIEAKRDTPLNVEKVRTKLMQADMPVNWGLFDTNCMILFHREPGCRRIADAVWNQLQTISVRDQLALPLVLYEQQSTTFKTETLLRAFEKTGQHIVRKVE